MSTSPQKPPLRPGDHVRFIHDRDHLEVVESCEFAPKALTPHWQVVTTWEGNCRIADASEFVVIERRHPTFPQLREGLFFLMGRTVIRLRAMSHRRELRWALAELGLADLDELVEWLDTPPTEAERRFLATRERITARPNPALLVQEAIRRVRVWTVTYAVVGAGS